MRAPPAHSEILGSGPGPVLLGAGGLLAFVLVAVLAGRGPPVAAPPEIEARPAAALAFRAEDRDDGSVALREAGSLRVVATIRPGEDGFVRGTLRGLAQARQREGLGPEAPFRLVRYADGRLALEDASTGRTVALQAFGPTNAAAFGRILEEAQR
ncbi:photosynthetic complex assembly protein PuhC [Methylobacterium radiodurans]|uniref:Photosynthetic complex assembly protein n=1 Tax=Methylobacterium radiodurans TaxID=2202828 RepID=A0A2U8VVH6_9HYPH|nr:photosynthetic complex assembly protein PuhC [Methylobacterium radiodurans]AWN37378.1 photosynthetic complex assembly protein [Methylobacterium radiodurans]